MGQNYRHRELKDPEEFGEAMHKVLRGHFAKKGPAIRVPEHYEFWAETLREDQGYESTLTAFLSAVAEVWGEHYHEVAESID